MLAELLQGLAGRRITDTKGRVTVLELEPPATEAEIKAVEASLPGPLPGEIREALAVSKGLANGPLESVSLIDREGFGFEELLPHAYSIGHDGFGNYWVLDLLPDTGKWGPVFCACHDPPVLAWQADSVQAFLEGVVAIGQPGGRSAVSQVREEVVHRIWRENPGSTPVSALRDSPDPVVQEFAASVPATAYLTDLRAARLGDGFSWGRYGPRTVVHRAGAHRIWAASPPEPRPGLLTRLFGGGG